VVLRFPPGQALVQTVDFLTPVVDDPFRFGQIAAANALSDVYAVGGEPYAAMNVCCFPARTMPPEILADILKGGLSKITEAGAVLCGGHSVEDSELKYGLSVSGVVDPAKMAGNRGLKIGDQLLLTKPVGTGIVGTAIKNGRAPEGVVQAAVASMIELNRAAAEALRALPAGFVHACTDVTGFGLIGHASELADASGVTLRIDAGAVPLLPGVLDLAAGNRPGGLASNLEFFERGVQAADGIDGNRLWLLYDPQTSGGLLIAAAGEHADAVAHAMADAGVAAAEIGRAAERGAATIEVGEWRESGVRIQNSEC